MSLAATLHTNKSSYYPFDVFFGNLNSNNFNNLIKHGVQQCLQSFSMQLPELL